MYHFSMIHYNLFGYLEFIEIEYFQKYCIIVFKIIMNLRTYVVTLYEKSSCIYSSTGSNH